MMINCTAWKMRGERLCRPSASRLLVGLLFAAGLGAIGTGLWRFAQPVGEQTMNESPAMAGLIDVGQSINADIARIVRPAINRTQKLAVQSDVIAALRNGNPRNQVDACNHAVAMSTEVDAIALFDRAGNILAINTVYASGQPIDPGRIKRVLQLNYQNREIVQRCIHNDSNDLALEFQTTCSITPALFDSTGLSIAYSVPVRDPQTGQKLGVISVRLKFDRVLDLIKDRSIDGKKDSIEFVTDHGGYFSEDINSGRTPAPIPHDVLAEMVKPLVRGGTDYSISNYAEDHIALLKLKEFNTLDGGGVQVMLIAGKQWLTSEMLRTMRFESAATVATGALLLVFASLVKRNQQLKLSDRSLREREVEARLLAARTLKSEQFARSTVDALSAHIAILDDRGTIVSVNKAWSDFAGCNSKEPGPWSPGANYLEVCDNARGNARANAIAMAEGIRAVIRGERSESSVEYTCHSPTERRWFLGGVTRFAGDGPVHVVVRHENITSLKLIDEKLKAAKESAEIANRAKSVFLANMSHEIRTPITAIVGFVDLMLDPDQSPSEAGNSLKIIGRNARHLLDLINDILDLSKIEAGHMTVESIACELPTLLSELMAMMRPRAMEKGLPLTLRFRGEVPRRVMIDPLRTRQILMNLVANAIKFTEHGKVEICVSHDPVDQILEFEVNDSGIGISREQIERLFRPFTQADGSTTRRFGGTGLGLNISRRLAQMLGGDVSVASVVGAGSTFTAHIAGAGDESAGYCRLEDATSEPADTTEAGHAKISGRILLAEDGKDNQLFISTMLRIAGLDVVIACNGRIAVDNALCGDFDLVLMDMQMPVLDGYAAAGELRSRGFSKPIVALTAHAMAEDRAKCISAGCSGYLTKPIDRELLVATVAAALGLNASLQASPTLHAESAHSQADEIISDCEGDAQMAEILPQYVGALPSQVVSMQALLDQQNLAELRVVIHQIKGAGGSYGFKCLTDTAAIAESTLAQNQPLELIKSQVNALVDLVRRVRGYDPAAEVDQEAQWKAPG